MSNLKHKPLTPREAIVFRELVETGDPLPVIAKRLNRHLITIKTAARWIYFKFDVHDRDELIAKARSPIKTLYTAIALEELVRRHD